MKRGKSKATFGYVLTAFFDQTSKSEQILSKTFFPPNEPQTAEVSFPVVLKHFRGNSLKKSLYSQKNTISERSSEILRKFVFTQQVWKAANPEENLDLL